MTRYCVSGGCVIAGEREQAQLRAPHREGHEDSGDWASPEGKQASPEGNKNKNKKKKERLDDLKSMVLVCVAHIADHIFKNSDKDTCTSLTNLWLLRKIFNKCLTQRILMG